jgi:hypothetical protein
MTRALLAAAMTVAATNALAQRPPGSQVKAGAPLPSPVPSYTAEVTAFTMHPAQPRAGDQVTFQLTLKNTGTTEATFPWFVGLQGGAVLVGQGTLSKLPPGSTQMVTATWRATAGPQDAIGTVSPPGVATQLNAAPQAARMRTLVFTVAQGSASSAAPAGALATQLIDWDKVRVAGGTFADGRQGPCQTRLGPITAGARVGEVQVELDCNVWQKQGNTPVVTPNAQGGRMHPVFFDQFGLKNGWRVKSFNVVRTAQNCPNASGWQVPTSPPLGGGNPKVQLALWANLNCVVALAARLEIEGPAGTNPYQ